MHPSTCKIMFESVTVFISKIVYQVAYMYKLILFLCSPVKQDSGREAPCFT